MLTRGAAAQLPYTVKGMDVSFSGLLTSAETAARTHLDVDRHLVTPGLVLRPEAQLLIFWRYAVGVDLRLDVPCFVDVPAREGGDSEPSLPHVTEAHARRWQGNRRGRGGVQTDSSTGRILRTRSPRRLRGASQLQASSGACCRLLS